MVDIDKIIADMEEKDRNKNGVREYFYKLDADGEQRIKIPGDATAYAGLEDGRFRFFKNGDIIGNSVTYLKPECRWITITSRQRIGYVERTVEIDKEL